MTDPDWFQNAGESWIILLLTCPLELVIFNLLYARFDFYMHLFFVLN